MWDVNILHNSNNKLWRSELSENHFQTKGQDNQMWNVAIWTRPKSEKHYIGPLITFTGSSNRSKLIFK